MGNKVTIRINCDNNTVLAVMSSRSAALTAIESLATHGVWVNNKLWYPPQRIVSAEIIDE